MEIDPDEEKCNFAVKSSPEVLLRIHNVLALAKLISDKPISLEAAVKLFINASFVPESFPALRIEVKGNLTGTSYMISLFEGGRIQSAGGVIPKEAGLAMKRVVKRLRKGLNMDIKISNFQVHNLLGIVDLAISINLIKLRNYATFSHEYEPSKFPALRLNISIPPEISDIDYKADAEDVDDNMDASFERQRQASKRKCGKQKHEQITASIFSNGKINFVGGKSVRSIQYCIKELRPIITAAAESQ